MAPRPADRFNEKHEATRTPPTVDPKHAVERAGSGSEQLREELPRPELKPTAPMLEQGGYSGPVKTPGNQRYGDANFGLNDWQRDRETTLDLFKSQQAEPKSQQTEQHQEQEQRREQER